MSRFEAEWRSRFERFARTHADEAEISGWSDAGLSQRLRVFQSLLASVTVPAGARVLELGCGGGTYVRLLGGLGHRAVGLDYSLPSLQRAVAADPGRKGSYAAAEAYALPFPAGVFDLVTCIGVVQTLEDPERALDEMVRVLRRGGWLVVEALNARAMPAMLRRAGDALLRRPPRVLAHPPATMRRWLGARGLAVMREAAILLAPRRLAPLGRLLEAPRLAAAIAGLSGPALAHSYLFLARLVGQTHGDPR